MSGENMVVTERGGIKIAVFSNGACIIPDAQAALELIADLAYSTGISRLVVPKDSIIPDFFKLSTGIAGDILQKFVNFHAKLAIVGDFSNVSSAPLRDFIRECNRGKDIFFVSSEEEALHRLSRV